MSDLDFTLLASSAADQFAQLEALFDAIREQAEPKSYLESLANLGLLTASRYSADMASVAGKEVHYG